MTIVTAGSLDTTFDTDGIVTTAIGSGSDLGYALGIQADDKIVVAGSSHNGSNNDFAIVRYNTDGSLDTSFGSGGKVTTAIGSGDDFAWALRIQADGKIVAAGSTWNGSNNDFAVVRYNTNGSLDTTFDTDGIVTTAIGSSIDEAWTLGIQADDKIVVAGSTWNGSNLDIAVVRYNPNGSPDTTFGTDGIVTTAIGSGVDQVFALGIQADDKIVVAGNSDNGINEHFAVVRYNPNGSPDTTFDTDGIVTTVVGSGDDTARALDIKADGKIVVAGYASFVGPYDFAVVRYNTDGSLDTTFDTDGKVTTAIGSASDEAYALGIQSDGKIVMAGFSVISNLDIAVVRYNTDGSLDSSFDTDGKVTTAISSGNDFAWALGIQSDGKIVVAGYSAIGNNDFTVVRYWP